jgi:hypothetical protein
MHIESETNWEPENLIAVLIWALEQPHAVSERDGELFITVEASTRYRSQSLVGHQPSWPFHGRIARCSGA